MSATNRRPAERTQAINLRIKPETRSLIDRVARDQGKSRSEFIIDASQRAAIEALLDNPDVVLEQRDFDAFNEALERGPNLESFRAMMETRQPWED